MKLEDNNLNYDGNMDKECVELCNALNNIPYVTTFESCCGHGKDVFRIWFKCCQLPTNKFDACASPSAGGLATERFGSWRSGG